MSKLKLKNILKEGFAWERKADGSLPTIADTTAAYEAKLREEAEFTDVEESAKPDYIDADGDGDETESMKQAFKDKEEMKQGAGSNFSEYSDDALRDMKINLSRFEGNEEDIKDINDELKRRKDNKASTNESMLITKGGLQALREVSLEERIRKNYLGNK